METYYRQDDQIRMVQRKGYIDFRGHRIVISKGFSGFPVALRGTEEDGVLAVYFCHQKVRLIDLRQLEIRKWNREKFVHHEKACGNCRNGGNRFQFGKDFQRYLENLEGFSTITTGSTAVI